MVDTRFCVSVHIMISLAYHQDELMSSESLAQILKTNPTFVRKLTAKLVEADLIQSFRGKNGGMKLARAANAITLAEIYVASQEEKCLISKPKKSALKSCPVSCSMTDILDNIVDGIEHATKTYLAKMTVQDLLKKVAKSSV